MQGSLIVILVAVICAVSAAVGVNRLSPSPEKPSIETRPVFVAATSIRRGAKIGELDVKAVPWPVDLIPPGVVTEKEGAVGRAALTGISIDEPLMARKLSDAKGTGFASNAIPAGMRACSIQTSGPSASVAGLVLPGDKVDVLLNLRESAQGETGGGSTITLLQSAEILAIDDVLDVDAERIQMWMKDGYASVTLLVTPEQAMLVALGQSVGTMSLALRNGNDEAFVADTHPVTINQIRTMPASNTYPLQDLLKQLAAAKMESETNTKESGEVDSSLADSDTPGGNMSVVGSEMRPMEKLASVASEPSRPSFIFTLRGNQSGMVRVLEVGETSP